MTTEETIPEAGRKPEATGCRWLAWSAAALGASMIVLGGVMTPAEGSNYADVLVDQAARIEAGMWVGAGIGVGVPAVVWLSQRFRDRLHKVAQ
jgi:hypothetical protein